ncbi:MAG TPA: 2Fe-2S iron-sulfur cluster-binding protein [Blastocatellia bacterium]|nr:2Fe-2S iron-sulfur cluster-binding protein [Blastocatellia bacterium]
MDTETRDGLFAAYDELVEIEVCGRTFSVPERNSLLRGFQFIELDAVSAGNYCWNGDCSNCMVWLKANADGAKCALACRTSVQAGLVVTRLCPELEVVMHQAVNTR